MTSPKTGNGIDKMAFTFTGDLGCETGDGVTCHGGQGPYNPVTGKGGPKQSFLGYMAYNRWWWHKDLFAVHPRRRSDEQSGTLSDAGAADQRRGCDLRYALFPGIPGSYR